MKKVLLLMLAVVFALSLAACGNTSGAKTSAAVSASASASAKASASPSASAKASAADTSWTDVGKKGTLILGFDQTFAPMGFKDDKGNYVGFDIDLATEVASRLKLQLKLQPVDWNSKVLELNSKNIDVIWNGLSITDDYKKDILFSNPYMNNRQIIIVGSSSGIKTIADLKGKKVAAQAGSSAMSAIDGKPEVKKSFGQLVDCPDYVEALMELKQGSVDAVVIDEIMGRYYITKDQKPDAFSVLEENFGEEQYGIGFRLKDTTLRDKVQETLNAMIKDGKAAEISKKWFGADVIVK